MTILLSPFEQWQNQASWVNQYQLICIRKIPASNLGRVTNSPGCFRGFPQSLQACAGKILLIRTWGHKFSKYLKVTLKF